MKKNNKFRNSGNSNAFSLNYKFDSVSPAGKCSGTALDLIKRYNDLAKEAHSSGNYVEMEVFRQYAEHYRKIVTEINERRGYHADNNAPVEKEETPAVETAPVVEQPQVVEPVVQTPVLKPIKKSFKVINIAAEQAKLPEEKEIAEKPKRTRRKVNAEAAAG